MKRASAAIRRISFLVTRLRTILLLTGEKAGMRESVFVRGARGQPTFLYNLTSKTNYGPLI
jgi:hypothetical protein